MTLNRSRSRVAAAVAATLLAGAGTAWFTKPVASADTALASAAQFTVATPTPSKPSPDDPSEATPPAGSSGAPGVRSSAVQKRAPRSVSGKPLIGRALPPAPVLGRAPAPTSFSIKRLGITMDVKPEGVARDGEMALAPDPADIGWYRYGPRPGDRAGATVLAAHVDQPGYGIGPLADLKQVRRGDVITVTSNRTVRRFAVVSVTSVQKTVLDLGALFTRSGTPRLHVVTCGGNFDQERRRYDENVVVVAQPVR